MALKRASDRHTWWLVVTLVVIGLLFYYLGPVLTPFLFGALLAYICQPLVARLERYRVPHLLAVIFVLLLVAGIFVALIGVMIPILESQIALLVERMPDYLENLRIKLEPWLLQQFGIVLQLDREHVSAAISEHWRSAGGFAQRMLPSLKTGGIALISFLVNLVLVPVVLFYVLRDWHSLVRRVDELIPLRWRDTAHMLARQIDDLLGAFFRGQLSIMVLMAIFYVITLWAIGLDLAFPIGVISGLLTFVPFLGVFTGVALATLAGLMQFGSIMELLPIWGIFIIAQPLEGYVFTPWLVGDKIGLHPVMVILAVLAFGSLFGFFGVLLALPASAVLLVLLRYFRQRYFASRIYNE